jgi:hypothetical protein
MVTFICVCCGQEFEAKKVGMLLCSDECRRTRRRALARQRTNSDAIRERRRTHYIANCDAIRERRHAWWVANRDRIRAQEDAGRRLRKEWRKS